MKKGKMVQKVKLTQKQERFFWWLRTTFIGLMSASGALVGLNLLPTLGTRILGGITAVCGALATWAGSILPGRGADEEEAKK